MKFFDSMEGIIKKKDPIFIGFFFLYQCYSQGIYHQSLMCDFLFIVEPGLFIIGLNKVNG